MRVKTANLTLPKFSSALFFEWTQTKVPKIKKFQNSPKCIPKNFFEVQKIKQDLSRKCSAWKDFGLLF